MPKNRIDTSGNQAPLGGVAGAFSGMNLPDLPAGEVKEPEKAGKPAEPLWKMGRVVLRKEKAHRGGKTVIVIDEFATHLPVSVIETIAKKLRAACGCGGTAKERRIEIQGDQPSKIRTLLEAEGFQVGGIR
ncbi:MAG TPA: translation initiation factor [Chthoniobacteraceae bacterium]|jgi:translation initiation factor 1|nr:translation initiation factor [Chthoniobacteraceae bacterium]